MEFKWSQEKNNLLQKERGVSFEEAAKAIKEDCLDVLSNANYKNQVIFVVGLQGYIHAVPAVRENNGAYFLKTIFPSRKLHKLYEGRLKL